MTTAHTIMIVARTEATLFARSWIFRLLAILTVLVLGFMSWVVYILGNGGWMVISIPSGFPYFVFLVLTIFESLIVIFGSVESMQRDQHYNTTASLHIRNFTNLNYVMGKVAGVLLPCLTLNAVFLIAAVVAQLFFMDDAPFTWQAYLFYPLVLNIPALVFIAGLSFLVTGLVRSKPLAMFLLVGYFALTFFNRDGIGAWLIDFNAVHLPLLSSSIIGLGNLKSIMFQRAIFFFLGIGTTLAAGLVFRRNPQSVTGRCIGWSAAVLCIVMSIFAGTFYVNNITRGIHLREHITALNEEYVNTPRARLVGCDLDVHHYGPDLAVTATLTLHNHHDRAMNTVVFSLNPGFIVRSVTSGDSTLDFTRDTQIIEVALPTPLAPGEETVLAVSYDGTVDDEACYPDIDPHDRIRSNRVFFYVIDRRYGFITDDYVLLTPECEWYPSSGIPSGMVFPDASERDFTTFTVDVETRNDLAAVSQGTIERIGDGHYSIRPETPLPGLTLAIGKFEKKAVMVDDVEVALYLIEGHDYFSEGFPVGPDEVSEAIAQAKNSYEIERGMSYPFSRFSLVETPVQFHAWERPWRTYIETVQPQMALVPEKGFYLSRLNKSSLSPERYAAFDPNTNIGQLAREIIENLARNTFMDDTRQRDIARTMRSRKPALIDNSWLYQTGSFHVPGYTYSAQLYPFLISLESHRYPIFNTVMEFYRKYGFDASTQSSQRLERPLLDAEALCMELGHNTVATYLANGTDFDTLNQLFILKSNQLFASIQAASAQSGFDTFLNEFITTHAYQNVTYEEFAEATDMRFGIDLDTIVENWYDQSGLPMFELSDVSLTEIVDGEYTAYQTLLTVTNTESVTGTVRVEVGNSDNAVDASERTRFITLQGYQSRQVGFVTDTPPPNIVVDYIVSQNLPILFTRTFGTTHEDAHVEPFEGERVVPYAPYMPEPGTIVVDNMDPGFEIVSEPEHGDGNEFGSIWDYTEVTGDYTPPLFRIPLKRWCKAVFNSSYGRQSVALFTRGGDGDGSVVWHAEIPEPGRYDLEYFFLNPSTEELNWYTPFGAAASMPFLVDYNLTVSHADTEHGIEFMPSDSRPGWQYVATFDLEPGQVDVTLSNKSEGMLVYADAIRWVKK